MLIGKYRVEEDLARIRHANLPDKYPEVPPRRCKRLKREELNHEERIGAKDVFAMIIAVCSLILPYAAAFIGVMGLIVWVIVRFF
jgi:hypothetical protein